MGKKIRIDASDVSQEIRKGGGGRTHVPEGEYLVKVNNYEVLKTKDESGRYIRWETTITAPSDYKGKKLYGNTSLKKEALWSLRNLIHAAVGKNIAGRVVDFDPDTVVGKVVGASVSDNVYVKDGNERITSQIDSFFAKSEYEAADEEDDEDDEDDEEEEDEEEEEEEEEERPRRRTTAKRKSRSDEDDDELEDLDVDEI